MDDANVALITDAYKQTHHLLYPPRTQRIYSYLESRGGVYPETLFFGLQYFLKKLADIRITRQHVDEAEAFCKEVFFGHNYFNRLGWLRIVNEHGGKIPIRIKAVAEGSIVPTRNVLVTMENTDEAAPFITNYLETWMLQVWYPITVATVSYQIKKTIAEYAKKTGGSVSPFHLNDFGYRGVSSRESAGIGGMAHLVNFQGTDTLEGIRYAMKYYDADVCGHSVMAAEHSTITAFGEEKETEAYAHILDVAPNDALVSIVSDSYDIHHAIRHIYGNVLKGRIMDRKGVVVVRPDSGDPWDMSLEVLSELWTAFGGTTNQHGYRTLDPHVRVIYGDGIDHGSITRILQTITAAPHRFSVDNIVFGMGGALLQQVHRDTQKFAFKCCLTKRDGEWHEVYKTTVSDVSKASKRGRLKLAKDDEGYITVRIPYDDDMETFNDNLNPVFENGELLIDWNFEGIRRRAV